MRKLETILRNLARNLASKAGGAEIAETAMILPLLFVFVMAIFWFGQAFRIYGNITHAAREGARAAITPVCATCASGITSTQNAINAVNSAMSAAHLNATDIQGPPVPIPNLCPCNSPSSSCGNTVQCDGSAFATSNICVQPNVQLSFSSQGGAGTCGTSVSFLYKYPFHFTLPCWPQPCTSLDLNKMTLPAQAQMRLETQ